MKFETNFRDIWTKIHFIRENAFENFCKVAAILYPNRVFSEWYINYNYTIPYAIGRGRSMFGDVNYSSGYCYEVLILFTLKPPDVVNPVLSSGPIRFLLFIFKRITKRMNEVRCILPEQLSCTPPEECNTTVNGACNAPVNDDLRLNWSSKGSIGSSLAKVLPLKWKNTNFKENN